MTAIRRLGLRLLLPALLAPLSAAFFWYGIVEDRVARAAAEKAGFYAGAAWHPNSLVQTVGSINLPAMLGGVLLRKVLPETILYVVVFGIFVPVLWWCVGLAADAEYGIGRALGQVRPPLRERAITLSCGISALFVLALRILAHLYSPRFFGVFWIVLLPVSILTAAGKWRRKWLPVINRGR
jgi:hypothetical protein